MSDKPLHVRVAEALGWTDCQYGWVFAQQVWCGNAPDRVGGFDGFGRREIPRYDTYWSAGGPLLERMREEGWIVGVISDNDSEWEAWKDDIGQFRPRQTHRGRGPTALVAVCHPNPRAPRRREAAEVSEECFKRPQETWGAVHCFHEISRNTYRDASYNPSGSMVKTEECCWCREMKTLHFTLESSPEHGPHGPKVWTLKP